MAKRGIKEPEGSESWPTGINGKKFSKRDDKGCWWSEKGHTHPSFGVRAVNKQNDKYRRNYDRIKWD